MQAFSVLPNPGHLIAFRSMEMDTAASPSAAWNNEDLKGVLSGINMDVLLYKMCKKKMRQLSGETHNGIVLNCSSSLWEN